MINKRTKRITILCGHYGSGKTSVAVSYAIALARGGPPGAAAPTDVVRISAYPVGDDPLGVPPLVGTDGNPPEFVGGASFPSGSHVALVDLDIVNPYFRAHDALQRLKAAGIRFIGSQFANSNLDVPALPQELYSIIDDRSSRFVLDVGGDDRGALALGRLSGAIKAENDYEMLAVINCYRPLTRTPADALAVMREIETASGIKFTGIVNNSNLGGQTSAQTVLDSIEYAHEVSRLSGLSIVFTSVKAELCDALSVQIPNVFPLIFA
ncbi:MAG: hypothetical protein FWD58_05720 [Firmicutes bacterium]|nr:hypothetical protein [Bacillota bacterium]